MEAITKFPMKIYGRFILVLAMVGAVIGARAQSGRSALLIGDSHGANPGGWAPQLIEKRTDIEFLNTCVSGNTFGFDNLGRGELNALKSVRRYIRSAQDSLQKSSIDDVVVMLGTNDCKAVFADRMDIVPLNLSALIDSIRSLTSSQLTPPVIYVVSPPPYGPDAMLAEKYRGAGMRLQWLVPKMMEVALTKACAFVDIYNTLLPNIEQLTVDGVHMKNNACNRIADEVSAYLDAYGVVEGDDVRKKKRDMRMREVRIPSSFDGSMQPMFYYTSGSMDRQPLIVRLHSWSGDYTQHDPMAEAIIDRGWNYIFPNFRGPNNTPNACGSPQVVQDIEDAILYAIEHGNVDAGNIHVVGGSGGGHATLLMYMRSNIDIKSFSAWVPISDLVAWYYQSAGRGNKYASHILRATGSNSGSPDIEEMEARSPYYMDTPLKMRKDALLQIYAGIHDGYLGSVPVTQSIKFYNKVAKDYGASDDRLIQCPEALNLATMRTVPKKAGARVGGRDVLLYRRYRNVSLTVFEGSHEVLFDAVMKTLPYDE